MSQDKLAKERSLQAGIMKYAIEEAMLETENLPNGENRLYAIDEILIKKCKTYDGVARDLHYEARTVQNWIISFVKLVGKKAGY